VGDVDCGKQIGSTGEVAVSSDNTAVNLKLLKKKMKSLKTAVAFLWPFLQAVDYHLCLVFAAFLESF
jgi:hypothetical protein